MRQLVLVLAAAFAVGCAYPTPNYPTPDPNATPTTEPTPSPSRTPWLVELITPAPKPTPVPPPTPTYPPLPTPQPTLTIAPSTQPPPSGSPAPTDRSSSPPHSLAVELVSLSSPVLPEDIAQLVIQSAPNATCTIAVAYNNGRSSAAGLFASATDDTGRATWTWRVDADATAGLWPIDVTCEQDRNSESWRGKIEVVAPAS